MVLLEAVVTKGTRREQNYALHDCNNNSFKNKKKGIISLIFFIL